MSTKLRITIVLPGRGLSGGVRVVATYGNKLIERGHQVTIVCLRHRLHWRPRPLLRRIYRDVCIGSGLQRDHLHDFKGLLLSSRAEDLSDRVPSGDVVVATHWLTADPVATLPESAGTKYYFIQHYEAHSFDPRRVDATWRLPMRKIVVAGWLRDLAAEKFGDTSAILVPNGLNPKQFNAPPRGLHRPHTVGLMYSLERWKGSAVAFEAVRIARKKISDLEIACFGADRPTNELPLPPKTRFHLRPPQNHLWAIYASADVWLCASETEGFALPPLEAMACRCPVVVTRCGGPMDFVKDGINGHIVGVGDAQAMANRVVAMLSNAALWKRMSDAAYETCERFGLDRSVDLFEAALRDR